MKLNRSKCSFGENETTFLGHNLSAKGLKPNHEKITAIHDIPDPTNKQEMQRLLGMINYLRKFTPNLSQITAPLRQLLKKDVVFQLEEPQRESIAKLSLSDVTSCVNILQS